jgi:tartrate dehydratase beta subunit/fumarate hydratase class I family protein
MRNTPSWGIWGKIHPCAATCVKKRAKVKSVVIESVGMVYPAWDVEVDDMVARVSVMAIGSR